jgi:glycosyltransferase involved in cell wall biosynthesis
MKKVKLSVVLATHNEENNIRSCLESVKEIAGEIIVFDEYSSDMTADIARSMGARVFNYMHKTNFHETKQKAIEEAGGDWILQLDADERVTPELAKEILSVINSDNKDLMNRVLSRKDGGLDKKTSLFLRHQELLEKRDGVVGKRTGEVVAFFIPRVNMFFGRPLIHGGVYPDGVIRLIKRGKARLPARDVHEQMSVDGEVGWLLSPLLHYDSPTFARYLYRNNRYTDLLSEEYFQEKVPINFVSFLKYVIYKPVIEFLMIYVWHAGFKDGFPGFVWAFFSSIRFAISYFKYMQRSE